jgi:hypothetical protein
MTGEVSAEVIGVLSMLLALTLFILGTPKKIYHVISKLFKGKLEFKEPVALVVSAIIFHKTSDTPKILFCWSAKQDRYILPGGHFYKNKRVWYGNKKVPAWYVDPNARPSKFLLEEKLKDKYGIEASLDTDFHTKSGSIHMTDIEPPPFLTLAERPSHDEGHVWHYDFYYMCKIESPNDNILGVNPRFKWCSLDDVKQLNTFANLEGVMKVAMDKKAKKAITDKRREEV